MKNLLKKILVFFAAIIVLSAIFIVFFMDPLIKGIIESKGTETLQTQVELGSLSTSLLEQSIEIKAIQIADPKDLDRNIVDVGEFVFNIDLKKALSRIVVINELSALDISFNKQRTVRAKPFNLIVPEEEEKEEEEKSLSGGLKMLENISIRSPEEILESENLESIKAANKVKQDAESIVGQWEEKLNKELGAQAVQETKQKIQDIQKRAKSISGVGDIKSLTDDIKTIQKDIKSKIARVKNLRSDLQKDIKRTSQSIADLKNLPKKDFERLKKKYSLNLREGINLAGGLMGKEIRNKLDKAWYFYKKISPHLNKASNNSEAEKSSDKESGSLSPKGFLLKHAKLSLNVFDQKVFGELNNLSDDQKKFGKPLVVKFDASKTSKFDRFHFSTTLDHTGSKSKDKMISEVKNIRLSNYKTEGPIGLKSAQANFSGRVDITNEKDLSGEFTLNVSKAAFSVPQETGSDFSQLLSEVVSSINQFYVKASIMGTLDKYFITVKSDLDQTINKSAKKALGKKIKSFEKKLNQSIIAATKGPLADAGATLSGLGDIKQGLNKGESSYQNLLKEATGISLPGGSKSGESLLKGLKLPF